MDVRLPNGKVIRGVPEGTPKDEVMRKAIAAGYATESDFPSMQKKEPETPEEFNFGERALGALENIATLASSAIAEPIAGLAGAGVSAIGGLDKGVETIEDVREALTYQPRTEAGQEQQQAIGETLQPVAEVMTDTEKFLGDSVFDLTGSPELAAGAASIPTAVLELIGVKGTKGLRRAADTPQVAGKVPAALSQAAPDVENIRSTARNIYQQIDNAGVRMNQNDFSKMVDSAKAQASKQGFDVQLTPKSKGLLDRLDSEIDSDLTATDVDNLRKVAQVAANSIDNPTDAAIGSMVIDKIDDFMDLQGRKISTTKGRNVGNQFRQARDLWSRVRKSEVLDEAVVRANEAASGFENGLRNEMRSILRNKKKRRGFSKQELDAMRQISQGGGLENTFKRLSKLGYGADQQTNVLASLFSAGLFAQLLGPAGVIAPVAIGNVSSKIAKNLGSKNIKFADEVVRAGRNGEEVVKAYLDNVPKRNRSVEEMTALLLDPSINLDDIKDLGNAYKANKSIIDDAVFLARKGRDIALAAQLGAPGVLSSAEDDGNQEQ